MSLADPSHLFYFQIVSCGEDQVSCTSLDAEALILICFHREYAYGISRMGSIQVSYLER